MEKGCLKPHLFDVKHQLTYPDWYFDAAYSHMLFNMRFSFEDFHFYIFKNKRVHTQKRKEWISALDKMTDIGIVCQVN